MTYGQLRGTSGTADVAQGSDPSTVQIPSDSYLLFGHHCERTAWMQTPVCAIAGLVSLGNQQFCALLDHNALEKPERPDHGSALRGTAEHPWLMVDVHHAWGYQHVSTHCDWIAVLIRDRAPDSLHDPSTGQSGFLEGNPGPKTEPIDPNGRGSTNRNHT